MKANRSFHTFEDWHSHDIAEKLGVKKTARTQALKAWTSVKGEILPEYVRAVDDLRRALDVYHSEWNEDELKFQFIGPLIQSVQFRGERFSQFSQRPLKYKAQNYEVTGIVDWMAAKGYYEPRKPYFFLHEYKKTRGTAADPLGQLLMAMLSAQQINADGTPIYGCYVMGRIWNFVLLEGETYSESQAYDATDLEEIVTIWLILQKTKDIIAKILENEG